MVNSPENDPSISTRDSAAVDQSINSSLGPGRSERKGPGPINSKVDLRELIDRESVDRIEFPNDYFKRRFLKPGTKENAHYKLVD